MIISIRKSRTEKTPDVTRVKPLKKIKHHRKLIYHNKALGCEENQESRNTREITDDA